jgi:hypothetical protein
MGVEVRSLISVAGEVTQDRRPRAENEQVDFRHSSAAYGDFSENGRLQTRVNQEVTVAVAGCLEISASMDKRSCTRYE